MLDSGPDRCSSGLLPARVPRRGRVVPRGRGAPVAPGTSDNPPQRPGTAQVRTTPRCVKAAVPERPPACPGPRRARVRGARTEGARGSWKADGGHGYRTRARVPDRVTGRALPTASLAETRRTGSRAGRARSPFRRTRRGIPGRGVPSRGMPRGTPYAPGHAVRAGACRTRRRALGDAYDGAGRARRRGTGTAARTERAGARPDAADAGPGATSAAHAGARPYRETTEGTVTRATTRVTVPSVPRGPAYGSSGAVLSRALVRTCRRTCRRTCVRTHRPTRQVSRDRHPAPECW